MRKLLTGAFVALLIGLALVYQQPPAGAWLVQAPAAAPPSYTGPGDVVGSATVWYGLRAYSAAYAASNSKLANISRASDSHTCDILAASTGGMGNTANCSTGGDNGQSASSFCNSTTCNVLTLYDQSGGSNCSGPCDAGPRGGGYPGPGLLLSCIGTLPCGNSPDSTSGTGLATSTNGPSLTQPITYSIVFNGAAATNAYGDLLTYSGCKANYSYSSPNYRVLLEAGSGGVTIVSASSWYAWQAIINSASSINYLNGTSNSVNAGTSNCPAANVQLFTDGNNFEGSIAEAGIWALAFNSTQQSAMNSNQRTYYGF
jgi:hypothetical protein